MTNALLQVLIPILSTILAALAGVVVFLCKRYQRIKTEKDEALERYKNIAESYNRGMGKTKSHYNLFSAKDKNGNYAVELEPDIRQSLLKDFEEELQYYHKFDRVKIENIV